MLTALLLTTFICGCAHTPEPRLYLLRSETPQAEAVAEQDAQKPLIIMRPLQMAEYLNRPHIVIRKGKWEVAHAEFDRWAEPLETQAAGCLTDALAAELKDLTIKPFPWRGNTAPIFEISISILTLDGIPGDSVRLRAEWGISTSGKDAQIVAEARSDLEEKCTVSGISGVVAATEKILIKLSQTIAASIKNQNALSK